MKLIDRVLELFYPTKCTFCHKLTGGDKVCKSCAEKLPLTTAGGQAQKFPFIGQCLSPLYYEGDVRKSLHRYKFGGLSHYCAVYAQFMAKSIDENRISCDIITWVPLSRKRLRQRGYDQAKLLADQLSEITGIECRRLLKKTRNNPAQSGTGGAEKRRANVSGVYTALSPEKISGKSILIVDDIVTTGATLSECGRMLMSAGAREVKAVTVARKRN